MHTPRFIQSPYTAADFWTQWSSTTPRMCMAIKVTSKADFGSTVLAFTTNTRNMTLPGHSGVTFKASPAITPTIIEQGLDEPTNLELTGIYNSDSFTQFQVLAGMWNFAEIEVFSVCWNNVNLGELLHFDGNLGEFKDYGTYFTAEGRGKISRLSNEVNIATSRLCRVHEFRDEQCGHTASTVTIDSVMHNIVHTGVQFNGQFEKDDTILTVNASSFNDVPENFFTNGKATGTSGVNTGVSREIAYSGAPYSPPFSLDVFMDLQLKRSFPFTIATGNQFTFTAGCDRTPESCMKFGNIVNRRAEDFIPGIESVQRIPV